MYIVIFRFDICEGVYSGTNDKCISGQTYIIAWATDIIYFVYMFYFAVGEVLLLPYSRNDKFLLTLDWTDVSRHLIWAEATQAFVSCHLVRWAQLPSIRPKNMYTGYPPYKLF